MTRLTGTWATVRGHELEVIGRTDTDTLTVVRARQAGRRVTEEVSAEQVGTVIKVVTTATWRGGVVTLAVAVEPGVFGFDTSDHELAERESLYGDQYSGWSGTASVEDLEDIEERITVLREGGHP